MSFNQQKKISFYFIISLICWTIVLGSLTIWHINRKENEIEQILKVRVDTLYNKDQALRLWAASYGGVYVPVDKRTISNMYLDTIVDRDIKTPSGMQLTLVNPAYLIRLVSSNYSELYGVSGHLTSLLPINPKNKPAEWEKKVLEQFENGVTEYAKVVKQGDNIFIDICSLFTQTTVV